ncbi:MAG: transcriptional regulator [Desulfarculus sp.]|jgi:DNA-binding transcriptional ArsR family regulator|nr:MAG: transcriptional regulator [Desulfarculus sp.]
MTPRELARICKCLSADTRLRLLRLLKEQTLCVGALARRLRITPGAVSQHLRVLREAGLVVPEKRGYFVHYRVDQQGLDQWLSALREVFGSQARPEYGPPAFFLARTTKGEKDV